MTKAEMKMAVDDHVWASNGDAQRLRLQAVDTEPRFSRGGRYLLTIDLLDDGSDAPLSTVHVMTRATVTRQQLLDLVDGAVDEQKQRLRLKADTTDEREVIV